MKNRQRNGRQLGVTLGESMVAIAILAVLIVVVIGLFVKLMSASTKGLDQTVALDIAQNKLDQASQSSAGKWQTGNSEAHSVSDPRTPTVFYWQMGMDELTEADPTVNLMGDVYKLDLEVYWWPEKGGNVSHRLEYGRQSVRLSRIVYIENMKQP